MIYPQNLGSILKQMTTKRNKMKTQGTAQKYTHKKDRSLKKRRGRLKRYTYIEFVVGKSLQFFFVVLSNSIIRPKEERHEGEEAHSTTTP